MTLRPRRVLLLIALFCLTTPSVVRGQTVVGAVTEETTGAPLGGVLVTLVPAEGGADSLATLTDGSGRYRLAAAEGRYRIRAERIGLATVTTDPVVVGSGVTEAPAIVMGDEAIQLEALHVDARVQECRVDPLTAGALQRWWGEARKAVGGVAQTVNAAQTRFGVTQFRREWSPDLHALRGEKTNRRTVFSRRPFVSAPADSLAAHGYVQGDPGSRSFFAPDADVLLSDSFLGQHCFKLVHDPENPTWIGLHFEPTRKRKEIDILGSFWVDTLSSRLKEVEFTYANLPHDLPGDAAGGRVEFDQLPDGAWVISQWWVRMPEVSIRRDRLPWGTTDTYGLRGYVDEGGVVREVSSGGRTTRRDGGVGVIRGTVRDSLSGEPVTYARVMVTGTALSALTDGEGDFVLPGVPTGRAGLTFFHPSLSALGVSSSVAWVDVPRGDTVAVSLRPPTFADITEQLCSGVKDVRTILVGHLAAETGEPLGEREVRAQWLQDDLSTPGARDHWSEAYTGTDGRYVLCRLPADTPVDVTLRSGPDWLPLYGVILESRRVLHRESVVRTGGGW